MRLSSLLRHTASTAVVGAVVFGFTGVAAAQDGPTTIDDIIVTAQKREQSLQDVPIVVTSLSQEMLQDAGVKDIKDLQILTPGMTVTSTTTEASTTARIRGVGTVGDNPGLESSVGVVIDGVYRSRNGVGFGDLGELSRIEVLKGPQGTLFGKNTSAGVINIITEQPSFTPGFGAELTGGNYGAWGVAGSVTGPISEQIAGRLYMAKRERDGLYDVNVGDGPRTLTDDANQDFWTARGQLLILPSDTASIRIIADYSKRDEYCCVGVQRRVGPTYPFIAAQTAPNGPGTAAPTPGFGFVPFSRLAYANRDTGQQIEDMGLSAEANLDLGLFGGSTLTSVTSFRDWSTQNGMDVDYTGADIAYRNNDGEFYAEIDSITQEFRLAGATDRLDWLVGLFATRENVGRGDTFYFGADYAPVLSYQLSAALNAAVPAFAISPNIIPCFTQPGQTALGLQGCLVSGGVGATGPSFSAGQSLRDRYSQRSESVAVFTNNTFKVTDAFDITMGLRYTHDSKRLQGLQTNVGPNQLTCAAALGNAATVSGVLGAANAGPILARLCLPWSNPFYNNRTISEKFSDGELSGTIKGSYRLNDSVMAYASYARGYKSFGYNMDRVQGSTTTNPLPVVPNASLLFPSEVVDSYEAGLKTTLFDRTVLLNVTYFDQTFTDFQLNTFLGTAFVVESIPELTARGVDADFMWFTPLEGLSIQAGATYTDAKYSDFTRADLVNPDNFPGLSLLPGARASFAPEWSLTGGVNFDREIGNGLKAGFALSAKYQTEYNTGSDLLPYKMQDAYTVVNGRISFGSADDRWTMDIWAQNLLDEEYVQVAYNGFLQGSGFQNTQQADGTYYSPAGDSQTIDAFLGAPRTYGVTLRVKY
ncbi:MAG: TonB-dependent receptor [Brevundimonas sp.]|uniref:TonB-dependent receptor n=1 Tax=Brevundimonas sp. TaxID=1871086 RepID=UPI00122407A9|nr:TonB-dependent receptor [Brevundimonas sp.]RZJ18289.1 MAG: TonB-dependent receptor [Brevundimonas sp.]